MLPTLTTVAQVFLSGDPLASPAGWMAIASQRVPGAQIGQRLFFWRPGDAAPASPSAAAATAAAAAATLLLLASLASLAKPLEVVAVLGGMGMPVVVDAEGAIIFLLWSRGRSGSARLLGVGFSREDRSSLALLGGLLLLGAFGGLPRLVLDE